MPAAEAWHGFIDESGSVSPYSGSRYFVVAALMAKDPRPIELHVKRTHAALGHRARMEELKASSLDEAITARLLQAIAAEAVEVAVVALDKGCILRPPLEAEGLYRGLLTRLIGVCLLRHSHLRLCLDRRYTGRAMRDALEEDVRAAVAGIPNQVLLLRQEDSRLQRGLQAVDSVCWAFYRKYEHSDSRLSALLGGRVVAEELVERQLW